MHCDMCSNVHRDPEREREREREMGAPRERMGPSTSGFISSASKTIILCYIEGKLGWSHHEGQHGVSEFLLCSDIQEGGHSSHIEMFYKASPICHIELKLDGRHRDNIETQN